MLWLFSKDALGKLDKKSCISVCNPTPDLIHMYQVVVGGMVNCPKESFELAGIPMHQDEVCDHVLNDLL